MFSDTGKLPAIDYIPQDKDHVLLKYKNDIVRISSIFLQKLVSWLKICDFYYLNLWTWVTRPHLAERSIFFRNNFIGTTV